MWHLGLCHNFTGGALSESIGLISQYFQHDIQCRQIRLALSIHCDPGYWWELLPVALLFLFHLGCPCYDRSFPEYLIHKGKAGMAPQYRQNEQADRGARPVDWQGVVWDTKPFLIREPIICKFWEMLLHGSA